MRRERAGSLLGLGGAECCRGDEQLGLGRIDLLQFHHRRTRILLIRKDIDFCPEVIHLAGFGREAGGSADLRTATNARLPIGAEAVIAGVHGIKEIRLVLVCANPGTIQTHLGGDAADFETEVVGLGVLDHENERLARFRLRGGVLFLIRLDIEIGLGRAATCRGASGRRVVCAKRGDAKTAKKMATTMVFIMSIGRAFERNGFPSSRPGYLGKAARGGELGVPVAGVLDGALLRAEIHVGEAETLMRRWPGGRMEKDAAAPRAVERNSRRLKRFHLVTEFLLDLERTNRIGVIVACDQTKRQEGSEQHR